MSLFSEPSSAMTGDFSEKYISILAFSTASSLGVDMVSTWLTCFHAKPGHQRAGSQLKLDCGWSGPGHGWSGLNSTDGRSSNDSIWRLARVRKRRKPNKNRFRDIAARPPPDCRPDPPSCRLLYSSQFLWLLLCGCPKLQPVYCKQVAGKAICV